MICEVTQSSTGLYGTHCITVLSHWAASLNDPLGLNPIIRSVLLALFFSLFQVRSRPITTIETIIPATFSPSDFVELAVKLFYHGFQSQGMGSVQLTP